MGHRSLPDGDPKAIILIVDDEQDTLAVLRLYLSARGFEILTAVTRTDTPGSLPGSRCRRRHFIASSPGASRYLIATLLGTSHGGIRGAELTQ